MILDIIRTTSSAKTSVLFAESLIRKPRKVDHGQRVPSEVRNTKNHAETLGKEECRTQKGPKLSDLGTKQENHRVGKPVGDRRPKWRRHVVVGSPTCPHTLVAHAHTFWPPDLVVALISSWRSSLCRRCHSMLPRNGCFKGNHLAPPYDYQIFQLLQTNSKSKP